MRYVKFLLWALVTGCSTGNAPSTAAENSWFQIVSIEKRLEDSSVPVGYWETSLAYPQVSRTDSKELKSLNEQIVTLVNRYSCEGAGDQTFSSGPVYANGHVLSFYYEAMWMCQTMPSPDSTSGVATFDMEAGTPVRIHKEFNNLSSQARFLALANRLLKEKLGNMENAEAEGCVQIRDASNAMIVKGGITLKANPPDHSEQECPFAVVIPKSELGEFFRADSVLLK